MKTSIPDIMNRIKVANAPTSKDLLVLLIIVLASAAAFALGRLSVAEKEPLLIQERAAAYKAVADEHVVQILPPPPATSMDTSKGLVLASKTGSKYFFPWCGSARSIKEENKVWFASVEAARAAGYSAATNCKGLR